MGEEEHFIEVGKRHWPLRRIVGLLAVVLVTFIAGVGVGRGNLHFWSAKAIPVNSSLSNQLDYSSVNQLYKVLNSDFDGKIDNQKLIEGIKKGMVEATGDPYTEYFNPTEAKEFNKELSGTITGIGAKLGKDDNKNIVVMSPLPGYPAEKAGLKPKDIIAAINGQSTQGMSIDAAVNKIRGTAGTKVTLTIVRGENEPFSVTITRQEITVPNVVWSEEGSIGYLQISQFTSDTLKLAKQAAQEFKDKKVRGVVLDLRGDPGGYLDAAVGVSSLWLDNGKTVVQEKRGNQLIETQYASGNSILRGLPTVVLIDGGSASASEITAGALRDNGAATLVGDKSFGKGSVQQVENFPNGSELKVTIARWYTPAGKNIDKQGIKPDVAVSNKDADIAAGKDPQKDKAIEILKNKI